VTTHTSSRAAGPSTTRRPHRHRRAIIVTILVCLLVAALVVPAARLVGQIDRIAGVDLAPRGATGSLDVLVAGTAPVKGSKRSTWMPGDGTPVSLMVMHVDSDKRGVTMIGIPMDLSVKVPGDGRRTLAEVASTGTPAQLIAAVEGMTVFPMDHLAVLDWRAFKTLIDRAGGLRVSTAGGGGPMPVGGMSMQATGEQALKTVVPSRDVDTATLASSQLRLMDAVVEGTLHRTLKNPLLVYNFLDSVTQNLAVDEGWSTLSMARLFLTVLSLPGSDMKYVTVPVFCPQGKDRCRPRLDVKAAASFWNAVEQDRVDEWLRENQNRGLVQATI
jgi:hypothetical protein